MHPYDIIIIGGGGMGSASAHHSAKSGARVLLLLDREDIADCVVPILNFRRTKFNMGEGLRHVKRSL